MSLSVKAQETITFYRGSFSPCDKQDYLAVEAPLEISLKTTSEEKSISLTMRTPGDDKELALGYLFAEGILKSKDEIYWNNWIVEKERIFVPFKKMPENLSSLERGTVMSSSCGVCGKSSLEGLDSLKIEKRKAKESIFSHDLLYELPSKLKKIQSCFKKTGGLHGAALVDHEGRLLVLKEDVGRHNAVDKLFGHCFMEEVETEGMILLLSGRASYELLQKAARSKISLVAAIGAPSSMAVSLAREHDITLVGFLKENSFNCYEGEKRISYE
ncbi:MAG: formate dehydrogenase accessory sulfurtransferase FdhD [Bdellovibrionota bacterium]|nr:formate dehydrogenase accessory sulfurtransferase FdhD [Bdellovibrionota bacterium]